MAEYDLDDIELGAHLRAVRMNRGYNLGAMEVLSDGKFHAVTVGSYERGDRRLTVHGLRNLAVMYGLPFNEMVPPHWNGPKSATDLAEEEIRAMVDGFTRRVLEVARDSVRP